MTRTAPALAVLAAAVVLSACSTQDSPTASPTTNAPAASAPATTAASAVASAPVPAASTTGEPVSGPDNPDGLAFGLLTAVGADRVVRYDKVDYLPSACDRRTESQVADARETLRVCFSNINARIRTVTVAPDVVLGTYLPDGSAEPQPDSDYDDLRRVFAQVGPQALLPVRLTVAGGIVTRIDEAGLLAG